MCGGGEVRDKREKRDREKQKSAVEEECEKMGREKLLLLRGLKQLNRKLSSEVSKCLLLCYNCLFKRVYE